MKKIILCTLLIGSVTLQGSSKNLKELSKELSKAELTLALKAFIKETETHFKGIDARLENIEQEQTNHRNSIHSLTKTFNTIPAPYDDTELRNITTALSSTITNLQTRVANLEITKQSDQNPNLTEPSRKSLAIDPRHLKYLATALATTTTGYWLFYSKSGKNAGNAVLAKLGFGPKPVISSVIVSPAHPIS